MTYRVSIFYCRHSKVGTPHEYDEEYNRARCIPCADREIKHKRQSRLQFANNEAAHMAALDGPSERIGQRK